MPQSDSNGRELRRGPRYDIAAPVLFRTADTGGWSTGSTVNMGPLGLLLRTREDAPPLRGLVELRVSLEANGPVPGADVICAGRVVWTAALPTGEVLVAATIDQFRFEKREQVSPVERRDSRVEAVGNSRSTPWPRQES